MIQVLRLRSFVPSGKTETVTFDKLVEGMPDIQSIPWLFRNITDVLDSIPEPERWNLFYTLANCTTEKRQFSSSDIIAFDIDGTSDKWTFNYMSVVCEAAGLDISKTGIVSSGNGLHFIVQTTHTVVDQKWYANNRHHYKAVCNKIDKALADAGLPGTADPT
ncbi:MAG: hypothetical protein EHM73_07240, partial [Chroococcales cyanobacterium metabat2.561]